MPDTALTVLVVDDYPEGADAVADLLTFSGFPAHAAHSGAAALDATGATEPDVVVLDPLMDGGSGWEVAAWLRRRDGVGPALVALTWGPCDLADCRDAGFEYLVLKRDDPRALVAAVSRCARPSES